MKGFAESMARRAKGGVSGRASAFFLLCRGAASDADWASARATVGLAVGHSRGVRAPTARRRVGRGAALRADPRPDAGELDGGGALGEAGDRAGDFGRRRRERPWPSPPRQRARFPGQLRAPETKCRFCLTARAGHPGAAPWGSRPGFLSFMSEQPLSRRIRDLRRCVWRRC